MYDIDDKSREELMMRTTECYDIFGSIEEKLARSRYLYETWGEKLRQEPQIIKLFEQLEQNIKATWQAMHDLGVVETCRHCDEHEGGSCCGAGIENKYDPILLFMNLLLGVPLPEQRYEKGSCFFLGDRGCKLMVRLVLCVDYLCPKLHKKLPHDNLVKLQAVSGEELLTGFILYDTIKKFLMKQ